MGMLRESYQTIWVIKLKTRWSTIMFKKSDRKNSKPAKDHTFETNTYSPVKSMKPAKREDLHSYGDHKLR